MMQCFGMACFSRRTSYANPTTPHLTRSEVALIQPLVHTDRYDLMQSDEQTMAHVEMMCLDKVEINVQTCGLLCVAVIIRIDNA
jgi:hypothetical protein